jgi:hypothetical protein
VRMPRQLAILLPGPRREQLRVSPFGRAVSWRVPRDRWSMNNKCATLSRFDPEDIKLQRKMRLYSASSRSDEVTKLTEWRVGRRGALNLRADGAFRDVVKEPVPAPAGRERP